MIVAGPHHCCNLFLTSCRIKSLTCVRIAGERPKAAFARHRYDRAASIRCCRGQVVSHLFTDPCRLQGLSDALNSMSLAQQVLRSRPRVGFIIDIAQVDQALDNFRHIKSIAVRRNAALADFALQIIRQPRPRSRKLSDIGQGEVAQIILFQWRKLARFA